jgi:hypothetical protein
LLLFETERVALRRDSHNHYKESEGSRTSSSEVSAWYKPPRSESISALLGLFHPVFGLVEGFRWLPEEELVEVITRDDASDRFIGGSIDLKAKTLTLLRGNIEAVVTPFSIFQKSGDGTAPDFTRLQLTDYGQTVALGDYEASADSILYQLDPDYRRQLK